MQGCKRDDIISQWSTPIAFYGKVVDESGQAVAGANVDLSANDLSIEGTSAYSRVSDNNGLFSIDRIRGKFLHVRVSKTGYEPSKLDQFTFSCAGGDSDQIKPDVHNPVPFHLYKIMGVNADATPCSLPIKLPIEGNLVGIDLTSCRVVSAEKGQLVLSCKSNSRNREKNGRFAWEVTISAPGGGGVLTGAREVNSQAPETGYLDSLTVRHFPTDSDWRLDLNSDFFAKLGDGKLVRFHIELFGHNGAGRFRALQNPPGVREFGQLPP